MTDEEKDRAARSFEAWKVAVDVQKHFNDIEMRIRNYALTLLLAVLAGAGLALREHQAVILFGVEVSLATIILAAGFVVWVAFYFMDELWYHKLLLGAVKQAADIERALDVIAPGI